MSVGGIIKQKKLYLPGLVFPISATQNHIWDVQVASEVIDDADFETDADLIGIGGMGHAIFRILHREFRKGQTVFFGGYMASMIPDVVLENVRINFIARAYF